MPLETQSFFIIILSGFITVWGFRKVSHSKKAISDFEYLGFSAFWGVLLMGIYGWLQKDNPGLAETISNPFSFGLTLSFFGFLSSILLGLVVRFYNSNTQKIPSWLKSRKRS